MDPKASAGTGTITAHVIPRVDLGISGMGGLAKATVFLNLDASATTTFNVTGDTSIEVSTSDSDNNGITTAVNGCADVDAEFDVNAGADGSFFGVFNQSASVALFSKKINIFQVLFLSPLSLCCQSLIGVVHRNVWEREGRLASVITPASRLIRRCMRVTLVVLLGLGVSLRSLRIEVFYFLVTGEGGRVNCLVGRFSYPRRFLYSYII